MFEAYAVGIRLSLLGNVAAGLGGLARQFAQVHGGAVALQAQLNRIKLTLMAGGALAGTGIFGLAMVGKTVNAAKDYVHQLAQMNTAGMTHLEIVRATQAAWNVSRTVPTTSADEALSTIREFRMVFGDTSHAIENMPAVQKLQAIMSIMRGGKQAGHDEAYVIARALETKGAVRNPQQFLVQADFIAKAIVASGGKIGGADFLSAFKYGRGATPHWSDEFAYTILPTLIQELKAGNGAGGVGGPGSALMSAYAAVVGGTVTQRSLKMWQKLGLLDPSKVEWTKAGEAKGVRAGGIRGWETFQSNPYKFAQEILLPALQRAGFKDDKQMAQALQYLFPNRTAGFVMSQMTMQGWKFERDQRLIKGASGKSAYDQLMRTDPYMAELALQKQWHNMMIVLGYQILPYVIRGTLILVDNLRALGLWFKAHPTLTKALVVGFTALSAALAFSGTVLLLKGAFMAMRLAIVPLTALAMAGGAIPLLVIAAATLGVALVELYNNWPDFSKFVGHTVEAALGLKQGSTQGIFNSSGGTPFVPSFNPRDMKSGQGHVYLDGRKVGAIVSGHQAAAARQQGGTSVFDSTMSPILHGQSGGSF